MQSNDELDFAVAICLGWKQAVWGDRVVWVQADREGRFCCNFDEWSPSTNWAQGGPIMEQERIGYQPLADGYMAGKDDEAAPGGMVIGEGKTVLEAAMRCFVKSRIPAEWKDWTGGDRPLPPETPVEIKTRDGVIRRNRAGDCSWKHDANYVNYGDIVAYREIRG